MKFDYQYKVSQDEAIERLKVLGDYLKNRHGIDGSWNGNSAAFTGRYMVVKIDGRLTVDDGVVHFEGKDPGMLWRKKAIDYLRGKLETYLDPSTPVDELPRTK